MTAFDLRRHGARFAPEYPPHGHSDHLPMTWLALGALGAGADRRQRFAADYLPRLAPLPPADAHRRRVEALGEAMTRRGVDTVLEERLPELMSGWYRAAYHPAIRLAYGRAFGVVEEAAAGLAYLESNGPCPRLADLAARARPGEAAPGAGALDGLAGTVRRAGPARPFRDGASQALRHPALVRAAVTLEDNLARSSRDALAAFAASHDFFALHLVTGSHAFGLLGELIGPRADALLNLGLAVGYLAIGAPALDRSRAQSPSVDRAALLASCRDDEHDIKLAWTAWDQSRRLADPTYLVVAHDYLARRG